MNAQETDGYTRDRGQPLDGGAGPTINDTTVTARVRLHAAQALNITFWRDACIHTPEDRGHGSLSL